MAENILSSAASAVTGEVTRVLFSGFMGKLDRKTAAADMKLRRLDMLLIKINSAVEASEKHTIENASLLKWHDRLREAAAEGGEVLASFRQRETEAAARAQAQAQATGNGDDAQQQQHPEDPSSSSSSSTALATAIAGDNNNAPSGMPPAQGIFSATKALLFSGEVDMERLNNAVERLQDISSDISIFIKLLKLEIFGPAPAPPAPAPAPGPPLIWTENSGTLKKSRSLNSCWSRSSAEDPPPSFKTFHYRMSEIAGAQAAGEGTLLGRLEEAFATICRIVELADGRDLSGYEWLACWASILREAKWQGRAVLDGRADDDVPRCVDQEGFELGRFVGSMETLASEADSFSDLTCLCPIAVVLAS